MKKAFSLIEVLLAILIVGIAIFPISQIFSRGSAGTTQSKDEVLAYSYAANLLSYSQGIRYDNPLFSSVNTAKEVNTLDLPGLSSDYLKMDTRFRRYLTVKEWAPTGALNSWPYSYKILIVEVAWKSGGIDRKIQLTGLIYKGGF